MQSCRCGVDLDQQEKADNERPVSGWGANYRLLGHSATKSLACSSEGVVCSCLEGCCALRSCN